MLGDCRTISRRYDDTRIRKFTGVRQIHLVSAISFLRQRACRERSSRYGERRSAWVGRAVFLHEREVHFVCHVSLQLRIADRGHEDGVRWVDIHRASVGRTLPRERDVQRRLTFLSRNTVQRCAVYSPLIQRAFYCRYRHTGDRR